MNRSQQIEEKHDHEQRLKEMKEQNQLLLIQCRQLQEELEHYFIKNQELSADWVDDELPIAVAEAEHLRTVVAVQSRIRRLQVENALNARLVEVLTRSAKSLVRMVLIPGRLLKTWYKTRNSQSSTAADDNVYKKAVKAYKQCGFKFTGFPGIYLLLVLATYIKGGFQPTRKILAATAIIPSLHAKAYSPLVSYLIKTGDMKAAKKMAWYAYAMNSNALSLKRLALLLARAGMTSEAAAVLDALPKDFVFSNPEKQKVDRIRQKAKEQHLRKAKEKINFANRRIEMARQMATLTKACDEHVKIASERQARIHEITKDRDEQAKLASERQARIVEITKNRDEQAKLASDQQSRIHEIMKDRDEQTKLASERQSKIKQLESELPELQARQALFTEEMAKAEGQIEIIKEVLLHEPGD